MSTEMTTQRKINVLQLVNGFAIGGAELKLLELVRTLHEKYPERYNQIVCSVGQGGKLQEDFEKLGLEVHVFTKKHKFDFSLVYKVAKLMRQKKIDIVQTTLLYADVIGAIAAKLAKVPIVFSWETVSHFNNVFHASSQRRMGYRLAMKFVDKIVAVSGEVKQSLIDWRKIDHSKIQVIHYGVDLQKYEKRNGVHKKSSLRIDGSFPIIGVVGRLEVYKGHTFLMQALVDVVKKFPQTKCMFIGDGTLRSDLQRQAKDLDIEENILFLGFRDDITELLGILDIFILPSVSEGLPNAILEAMACSVPVIATSVGGIPEVIIDKKNGLMVPPKNVESLKNAILSLLENNNYRIEIGKKARKYVNDYLSVEKQVNDFKELYDSVYSEKMKIE